MLYTYQSAKAPFDKQRGITMKRFILMVFVMMLAISCAACGTNNQSVASNDDPSQSTIANSPETSSDVATVPSSESIPEPEPVIYTGNGDDVIDVTPPDGVWVLHVIGNNEKRHFAVKGYDSAGNSTELFVNTTDPYNGTTLDPSFSTATLEISATGEWTIEFLPATTLRTISEGETVTGSGDTVLLVNSYGSSATITGNTAGRHFAVKSYGNSANNLMVNTTDPYEGKVMIKGEPILLEINSIGEWSISF